MPLRTDLRPIASRNRHTDIQEHLKQYIITNRLKPGDRLPPEEVLVESLGISRSALREALRSMEALGIIAAQHGVGRVVLPFSFGPLLTNLSYGLLFDNRSVLQLVEIRKALDSCFIESAIHNLDEEDLAELSRLIEQMREHTEAGRDIEQEDYEFHRLLFARCGNELAYELFEVTWQARLAAMSRSLVVEELPPGTYQQHKKLLDAIVARDVEQARRLVMEHHWNIEQRFRQALEIEANSPSDSEHQP